MKLSDAGEDALRDVAAGKIVRVSPQLAGQSGNYKHVDFWQPPRQSPYDWLRENGFIIRTRPSKEGTRVNLTEKGEQALAELDANNPRGGIR